MTSKSCVMNVQHKIFMCNLANFTTRYGQIVNVVTLPVSGPTALLDDVGGLVPQDVDELSVVLEELHLGRGRRAAVQGSAQDPNLQEFNSVNVTCSDIYSI